ncbi:unnamed protein product, partial [marine sediment metagenome]
MSKETEKLNWSNTPFSYNGLVRFKTIKDGSCFFHAIVGSFYAPYQKQIENGKKFDRRKFIKKLRKDLSNGLDKSKDGEPIPYLKLSRGKLPTLAIEEGEKYTLENMKKELDSDEWS